MVDPRRSSAKLSQDRAEAAEDGYAGSEPGSASAGRCERRPSTSAPVKLPPRSPRRPRARYRPRPRCFDRRLGGAVSAAAASATAASERLSLGFGLGQLRLGRQLYALRRDDELQLGVTSANSSNGTGVSADPLDRVHHSLRRSTRIFSCSHSRSATFVAVTEPKSEPGGAGGHVEAELERVEPRGDAPGPRRPTARGGGARCASRFSSSRTSAGVARAASPRGSRKLRAKPRATLTTSPRRPRLVDVLPRTTSMALLSPT